MLDTLTPGDFVRAVKQLIDLLGQIAVAAGPGSPLASTAHAAADALRRGVVAYSSVGLAQRRGRPPRPWPSRGRRGG